MFCAECGAKIEGAGRFCQNCGTPVGTAEQASSPPPATMRGAPSSMPSAPSGQVAKNPTVAVVLSLFIVGLGQFYNNDWKKGLVMLGATILLAVPTAGLAWLGIAIWSCIDAYKVAKGDGKKW